MHMQCMNVLCMMQKNASCDQKAVLTISVFGGGRIMNIITRIKTYETYNNWKSRNPASPIHKTR